jgi:hypothetical protein
METDAHAKAHAMFAEDVGAQWLESRLDGERGAQGARRVIAVGGIVEQGQHAVAEELVHRPAVGMRILSLFRGIRLATEPTGV